MADIWEKAKSILAGNLNSCLSNLITTVHFLSFEIPEFPPLLNMLENCFSISISEEFRSDSGNYLSFRSSNVLGSMQFHLSTESSKLKLPFLDPLSTYSHP